MNRRNIIYNFVVIIKITNHTTRFLHSWKLVQNYLILLYHLFVVLLISGTMVVFFVLRDMVFFLVMFLGNFVFSCVSVCYTSFIKKKKKVTLWILQGLFCCHLIAFATSSSLNWSFQHVSFHENKIWILAGSAFYQIGLGLQTYLVTCTSC